jgi:alpha-ketoglutarate-dependent taurine dioxygenase
LLVAAHRVLHAREAFVPSGKRHLQDAYFELDNIANKVITLNKYKAALYD